MIEELLELKFREIYKQYKGLPASPENMSKMRQEGYRVVNSMAINPERFSVEVVIEGREIVLKLKRKGNG